MMVLHSSPEWRYRSIDPELSDRDHEHTRDEAKDGLHNAKDDIDHCIESQFHGFTLLLATATPGLMHPLRLRSHISTVPPASSAERRSRAWDSITC